MEDLLKLAVNYGLGIFFAVGISIVYVIDTREKNKQSYARELALMRFMEDHSLVTQTLMKENIETQNKVAQYQRQEHEAIMAAINLVKDSLYSLNNNIINLKRA